MRKETIVLSLGGSLVVPDRIDTAFLKQFKFLILHHAKKGTRFVIVVGGGKTCRNYQAAATTLTKLPQDAIDWLGIHATHLNAHLLQTIFLRYSEPTILTNTSRSIAMKKPILVAAGWHPGHSTDYDTILIAKTLHATRMANLSNIDYAYDKDPKKYKSAKPIKKTTWKEFKKLLPEKWSPGLNVPFDPIASRLAEHLKIEVSIINGQKIKNFENFLNRKPYKGTVIR